MNMNKGRKITKECSQCLKHFHVRFPTKTHSPKSLNQMVCNGSYDFLCKCRDIRYMTKKKIVHAFLFHVGNCPQYGHFQIPSARKSCSECGFKFVREVENLTTQNNGLSSGSILQKPTLENRTRRRCREKPHFFDSTEYNTTIRKRRKNLVKKPVIVQKFSNEFESKVFDKSGKDQINVTATCSSTGTSASDTLKDSDVKLMTHYTLETKEPSSSGIQVNDGPTTSSTPANNKNYKDKDLHICNILSEINRKIVSISCQPCI